MTVLIQLVFAPGMPRTEMFRFLRRVTADHAAAERLGLPVTEFRDTLGTAVTNLLSGADPATELKKATEAFQPILDKSNEV